MKLISGLVLLGVCVFVFADQVAEESATYPTKYDNFDVKEVIKNERLTKSYVECLLEKGPCTKEGELLKQTVPDALASDCKKCTEKQKKGAKYILQNLIEKYPELYKELEAKYDKEGEYKKKYAEEAKKEGIKLE